MNSYCWMAASLFAFTFASADDLPLPRTTWVGNTFGGAKDAHIQLQIKAMTVTADGTIFTDSQWDEDGYESGIYKDGAPIGKCDDLHGWGHSGGEAVAVDDNFVYLAMSSSGDDGANTQTNSSGKPDFPEPKNQWYCIRRYTHEGAPAPFWGGYGTDGSLLKVNSVEKAGDHYPDMAIHGLAVANGKLYASDSGNNQILVYSTDDLSLVATWPCPGCRSLTVDKTGNVWVGITDGPKVIELGPDGKALPGKITFAPTSFLSAVVYRVSNNSLYVADSGPDQDVKIYPIGKVLGSPTKPQGVIGTKGGIFSGAGPAIGTAGPLRFNDPSGVGFDDKGNIYVTSTGSFWSGGSVIECYNPAGKRISASYGLTFVDTAEPDPASETDVFSPEKHFKMNYSATGPGAEWSYQGFTANRFKYPDDPRSHTDISVVWVRYIDGHRFLFTSNMMAQVLAINRFDPATDGETAIPSVLISKNTLKYKDSRWPANQPDGEWIWRDSNGNGTQDSDEFTGTGTDSPHASGWGWWVDGIGDIWQCSEMGITHFICQGLDKKGNPIYDYATGHVVTNGPPDLPEGLGWKDLLRVRYYPAKPGDPLTDTMFLSGYTTQFPNNTPGFWGTAARVLYRYDNWSTKPTIHHGYPIEFPSDADAGTVIQGFDIAGKYIFAAQGRNPQTMTVYDNDTGLKVTTMVPGAEVGGPGSTGWLDIREPIHVFQRSNGEYLIFVEEDWKAKVLLYRWTPKS